VNEQIAEWFADEAFWQEIYPFIFSESRLAAADTEIGQVMQLTGVQAGQGLDLCCGPGRHSLALARRGFQVTAVDRTPFLLQKARDNADQAALPIDFVLEDMRRFRRPDAFDLVINIFTSFGYFADKADDVAVLNLVHHNLRPGGTVLLELMSKEWLARNFQLTASMKHPDGALLIQRHEIIDDWSRVKNEWIVIRDGRVVQTFEFALRVYSGQELKDLMTASGFGEIKLYGSLDGRPYGLDVQRLVVVARKSTNAP